ncbi:DUF4347 domain-containing protein [Nostoc sp. MG11]|uniref:DUF4347 domain-containing protein n=1 Tax=Nostoc sp. MG11 TaxID=2721166 RepID=UPI001865F60D|nr:DUF4347 domain-containing protein [Nostoc sp. MG11]
MKLPHLQTKLLNDRHNSTLHSIVFVDANVDDIQTLVDGVIAEAQVIVLDPQIDGVSQITTALQGRTDIRAIHIVAHGAPGCLYLGSSELSLKTINAYDTQLSAWASKDILLYGCNVAAGDAGAEFIAKLHQLTQANIAASTQKVGNAKAGGNWLLDTQIGEVVKQVAFSLKVMEAYCGVFAVSFKVSQRVQVRNGNPDDIAVGDFNNDGKLDFFTVSSSEPFGSLVLGNADGSFQPFSTVTARSNGEAIEDGSIALGDLNSDGKLDIIVASDNFEIDLSIDNVLIRFGDGNGSVQPRFQTEVTGGIMQRDVTLGDFNGDGKLDIAIANEQTSRNIIPGNVSVKFGNGNGSFQPAINTQITSYPSALVTADFNNDGLSDLAATDDLRDSVRVALSNGDGSFNLTATNSLPGFNSPQFITVGDFNNDANQDLVVADRGNIRLLLGNGNGNFNQLLNVDGGNGFITGINVGDFNNDGFSDLAVSQNIGTGTSTELGNVSVVLGNGDGSFDAATTLTVGTFVSSVAVGDFNNDGQQDLAVTDFRNNLVPVLLNTTIIGTANNNELVGTDDGEVIYGYGGNDILLGRGGNDSLVGGAGNDTLTGSIGSDQFVFNSRRQFATSDLGVDTIINFSSTEGDKILLDKTTFTALTSAAGSLAANDFATVNLDVLGVDLVNNLLNGTNTAAIIYNTATGDLFYNQNGLLPGFGGGGQFATLTGSPTVTPSDFVVQA